MYYIIITLLLYANSLVSSQNLEKNELPLLTFSEIKSSFFEEIKKSKYKNIGLSLRTGILSFGAAQLLKKKYSMFKKHGKKIVTLFFLLPLSSQAAAYYYFSKHSRLETFENTPLFRQQYYDVLTKRQEKSSRVQIDKKNQEDEKKLQLLIKNLTLNDLVSQTNLIEITDIFLSFLDNKAIFKKNAKLLKEKLYTFPTDDLFIKTIIANIILTQIKNKDLILLFYCYFTNTEEKYSKDQIDKLENSAKELIPEIRTKKLYKLELPPVPDEGIAGNEEKSANLKENNKVAEIKTDEYFDFNIKELALGESFLDNLSILVFYLLEINEEKKLEDYAVKLIEKTTTLMKENNIEQDTIQNHINHFLLNCMISIFGKYGQAYKEEKLTKFFIFPFVKNIDKDKAFELIHEFIKKNLRNTPISDIVQENTLQFIQNNNISAEEIKIDFLNKTHEAEQKRYANLLNKEKWHWFFKKEN